MKVYLAGPINGCTDEQAIDWRAYATRRLRDAGIDVLDPMARDYRGIELTNVAAIVHGDLQDIGESTHLLVNAPTPSVGTSMETWEATQHMGKIAVVVCPGRLSPWLAYCASASFAELDQAVDHLIGLK